MRDEFESLVEIKRSFDTFHTKSNVFFVYIAPINDDEFKMFIDILEERIQSNPNNLLRLNWDILEENFPEDTKLDLFISPNPTKINIKIHRHLLKDYIKSAGIKFKMV